MLYDRVCYAALSNQKEHEIKGEPHSGVECEADAEEGVAHLVGNARAELLQWERD